MIAKTSFFSVLALSAALLAQSGINLATAAELDRVGTFDFPTSGSPEAQSHFELGVGYLHSFGMTQAQAEFRAAQEIEPDFAMAYWGEAFTYQHPFFGPLSEGPGEALRRLGATPAERLAKAPTEREKGFLKAAEAYALTPGGMPERRTAWMNAMADLYQKFPDDDEVKAFYAVSMLSGATAAGPDYERINMQAGALALQLFKKNEQHPGAAHYVIHAFDDPLHAPIALEAASHYADIAPAVSHARHMPTHIFIQHGMWDEVSEWNHSAFQAGLDLWKPGDPVNDLNHSSDWGQYGDLQLGDLKTSEDWIAKAADVLKNNPADARSISTLDTMKARHIIESKQWQVHEFDDESSTDELLALGLSAASLGDLDTANQVVDRLDTMLKARPNDTDLHLVYLEVAALTLHKEAMSHSTVDAGKQQRAIDLIEEAITVKEQQRPPNGAASPLKPVHELAGEMLLEMGKADDAADKFEFSLLRLKNRPWSLLGAARSYAQLNKHEQAAEKYQALLQVWSDNSLEVVQEARRYLNNQS